jgi:hypothetical protein
MTSKASVATAGQTMTLTATGTDPKGQAVQDVTVYTKQ